MMNTNTDFGMLLYNLREKANMKPKDLADLLNVTTRTIYKWESNESEPSVTLLFSLSKIFNVPMNDMLVD